jgi:hypothetical protein
MRSQLSPFWHEKNEFEAGVRKRTTNRSGRQAIRTSDF